MEIIDHTNITNTQRSKNSSEPMTASAADPKTIVEKLLALDKDIRWVGVVDNKGVVLQNVQRPGIETITDVQTDELTLHILPIVMGLLWGRLIGEVGKLNCVVVSCI